MHAAIDDAAMHAPMRILAEARERRARPRPAMSWRFVALSYALAQFLTPIRRSRRRFTFPLNFSKGCCQLPVSGDDGSRRLRCRNAVD